MQHTVEKSGIIATTAKKKNAQGSPGNPEEHIKAPGIPSQSYPGTNDTKETTKNKNRSYNCDA